jgi:antitoxin VapB
MTLKTAKLFKTGGSQAVRLPAEFRLPGREVYVRRNEATGEVILMPQAASVEVDEKERIRLAHLDAFVERMNSLTDEERAELDRHPFERPLNVIRQRRNPFSDQEDE